MTASVSRPVSTTTRHKAVLAASIGNFIEWFEYTLYGFFAAAIATNFFPSSGGSLIPTFAAFAVSFVLRPLGALVFAHFGDRMGRRVTLAVAIIGMSVATFLIGVLPTYDTVGVLAPILLVAARVVQGFCTGGEFGGATAFMVEYAPEHRRGFYASWQMTTQFVGGLCAALTGAALSGLLTDSDLANWGWRVPFLITLPLGLIGFYLRVKLDETPQFTQITHEEQAAQAPLLAVLREHWRDMVNLVGLLILGTTSVYIIEAFLTAFLVKKLHMPASDMFIGMIAGMALLTVLIPFWALLSDRVGRRKPFLIISPLLAVFLAVPIFWLFQQATFVSALFGYLLLSLILSPLTGTLAIALADAFPTRVRYSGLSIAYSAGVSLFGGFTPLILASLVESTSNTMSPGYYLTGTAVVTLIAALLFKEPSRRSEPAEASATTVA